MSALDLAQAVGQLTPAERDMLIELGAARHDVDDFQLVGVERIRVEGALYVPDPCGRAAFVTPVRVDERAARKRASLKPFAG